MLGWEFEHKGNGTNYLSLDPKPKGEGYFESKLESKMEKDESLGKFSNETCKRVIPKEVCNGVMKKKGQGVKILERDAPKSPLNTKLGKEKWADIVTKGLQKMSTKKSLVSMSEARALEDLMSIGFKQNELIEFVPNQMDSDQDMAINQTQKVDGYANKSNLDVEVNVPLLKEITPEEIVEVEDCKIEFLQKGDHRFDIPEFNQ
ncbi:hypothetical protein V6N13_039903 [Hibiscus sabdariffa]